MYSLLLLHLLNTSEGVWVWTCFLYSPEEEAIVKVAMQLEAHVKPECWLLLQQTGYIIWFYLDNVTSPVTTRWWSVPQSLRISKNIPLQMRVLPKMSPLVPRKNCEEHYCTSQDFLGIRVYPLLRADVNKSGISWKHQTHCGYVSFPASFGVAN